MHTCRRTPQQGDGQRCASGQFPDLLLRHTVAIYQQIHRKATPHAIALILQRCLHIQRSASYWRRWCPAQSGQCQISRLYRDAACNVIIGLAAFNYHRATIRINIHLMHSRLKLHGQGNLFCATGDQHALHPRTTQQCAIDIKADIENTGNITRTDIINIGEQGDCAAIHRIGGHELQTSRQQVTLRDGEYMAVVVIGIAAFSNRGIGIDNDLQIVVANTTSLPGPGKLCRCACRQPCAQCSPTQPHSIGIKIHRNIALRCCPQVGDCRQQAGLRPRRW